MKNLVFSTKLIIGSLSIVILVMIASALVVSTLVNNQNRKSSIVQLEKSINIMRNDLKTKQADVLANARQGASMNNMGSRIKFLYESKTNRDRSMTRDTYEEIISEVYNVASTAALWKAAVYDSDGDLAVFVVNGSNEKSQLGYCFYNPKVKFNNA